MKPALAQRNTHVPRRGMGVTAIVTQVELSANANLEHFAAIGRHGDRAAARQTGHPIWHGALELRQERRTASCPMPTHKGAHNRRCQSGRGRHQQRKPPGRGSPRRRAPDIYHTISSCPAHSRQPGRPGSGHNRRCQSGRGCHQQRKPPAWGSRRRRAPDIYCTISSCPGLSSSDPFIRRQPGRAAWQDPLRVDQGV
jgi:hypothetical protein